MLPELLRPPPHRSDEREAEFARHNAALSRQLALVASGLIIAAALLWWPLDGIVLPAGRTRDAFASLRTGILLLLVPALLVLLAFRPGFLGMVALGTTIVASFLGIVGYHLGSIGGSDLGWFGDACMGLLAIAWIPMPLAWRVSSTALVGGALAFGYFGLHPGNLEMPGAGGQLSFVGFAVALAILLGEAWYRVTRRAFFVQLDLADANERLAAAGRDLSLQVAERTARLRSLALHLDTGLETERRRIGRELHDDLAQRLTAMRYVIARVEQRLARGDTGASVSGLTGELNELLDATAKTVREVTARLRPRVLEDLGLVPALEWLCDDTARRTSVTCTFAAEVAAREALEAASDLQQLALFRAAQEGVTNALKHARPSRIELAASLDDDGLSLLVRDDGRTSESAEGSGLGLLGLGERMRAFSGSCELRPNADGPGSQLRIRLPHAALHPKKEVET